MAYTRFNNSAQYTPANTYVPIPFEELLTAGMLRDKRYSENEAAKDAFYTGLRDIDVHEADQPLYQRKIQELNTQLQDTIKSNPDVGSYEFKRSLDDVISTQSRDPLWRAMKYNSAKARELEKAYSKAKAEGNTPANLAEIEDALQNFYSQGSEGVGFLKDTSPYKYVDYNKPLEELGQGFIREGDYRGLYDENFNLKTTTSRDEIPVGEVAAAYGYNYDPKTNNIQLAYIPPKFLDSDAGNQLKREAMYRSKQTGEEYNSVLTGLYKIATQPLVSKYSGGITKKDQDLSSVGSSRLLEPKYNTDQSVYSVPSKPLEDKREVEGKVEGWKPTAAGQYLRDVAEDFVKSLAWFKGDAALKETQKKSKDIVAGLFGDKQGKDSEDFKAIERQIKIANPNLKGRELQSAIEDHVENFFENAKQMPVGLTISPKEKDRQAKVWFGGAADNGTISAEKLSGAGINQKVFDPADPSSTKTLGEIAKKSNTVEYIGPLKNNNLYKPGLHQIIVDGKTLYMSGTNQEEQANMLEWNLYDYERHPSGIGNWFTTADNPKKQIRTIKQLDSNGREKIVVQVKNKGEEADRAKTIASSNDTNPAMADIYFTVIQPALTK